MSNSLTLSPNQFALSLATEMPQGLSFDQRFLRCPLLGWDAMLIPLESVLEVFPLEVEAILPVPDMPDCVMGTLNRRGEFLWLVDLQARLGSLPLSPSRIWMGIALSAAGSSLAVAVPDIGDIEEHDGGSIQSVPPGLFPPELQPFVSGYLIDRGGSTRVVLSPAALLKNPVPT